MMVLIYCITSIKVRSDRKALIFNIGYVKKAYNPPWENTVFIAKTMSCFITLQLMLAWAKA